MRVYRAIAAIVTTSFTIGSAFIATEYIAYSFNFADMLGKPIAHFIIPIYLPFSGVMWYVKHYHSNPMVFLHAAYIFGLGMLCNLFLLISLSIIKYRHSKNSRTHGTARWATTKEVKQMSLTSGAGVVLGSYPGVGLLTHNGPEHILVNAPTRSGKGVGIIVPTLLSWPESVFVLDIKQENWAVTAGFRQKFSHAICFDPTSNCGACWNPLLEVRKGINEVKDVQNIADVLVDPDGSVKNRDHWAKTGHALLVATILHVLYAEKDKTLSGVANFLANPDRDIIKTLLYMKSCKHLDNKPHPVIASAAQEMLNKSEAELSGVLSTAMSFLGLYRDPVVARNTKSSDFYIDDLMNAKNPVSLYLVLPAGDIDRLMPLARLMINMACRRLTEAAIGTDGSPHKHKLLLLLDEFPALGCMTFFKKALGFVAGYNIKCMLVCQSYNNIYEYYGHKNSIFDNCHIRVTMAPNDNDTAKEIATSLGKTTVKRHQINFTGKRLSPFLGHISVADQETGRHLLNPDEVQKLPDDKLILMIAKNYPVMLNKIRYYLDEPFKSRCIAAPMLAEGQYIDLPVGRCSINGQDGWYNEPEREHELEKDTDLTNCNIQLDNNFVLGVGGRGDA